MNDMIHKIFSVPIWGFMMNDQVYQSKDYIDHLMSTRETTAGVKKSNMGGFQTPDNLHLVPVFRELKESIEKIATTCFNQYTNTTRTLQIAEMWGNINQKGSYNGNHIHGEDISGVFYLQVPQNSGKLVLCNPAVRGDGKLLRENNYSIQPQPLACILFPSWLEHYVEQNNNDQERISISFNLRVQQ